MAVKVKALGNMVWNSLAKPMGDAIAHVNGKVANSVLTTLAEPWVQAGTAMGGRAARRGMVPHPEQLSALSHGITDFVAKKHKTPADVHALIKIVKEQGLDANKDTLLERFPYFREKDVDNLVQVFQTDLQQTYHVEDNRIHNFPKTLIQSLKEISTICSKYGMDTDEAVHTLFLRQMKDELNKDAEPQVKNARAALEKLLFPENAFTPKQLQTAISQVILQLDPLLSTPQKPTGLTKSEENKIRDLIIALDPHLEETGQTSLTVPIKTQVEKVHGIVKQLFEDQQGLIPRSFDHLEERVARLGTKAKDFVGGFLPGAASPPAEGVNGPGGLVAPAGGATPLNSILDTAKGWFNSVLFHAENALSQQAARGLATVLEYCFTFVEKHLHSNVPEQEKTVKDAIQLSIDGLKRAQDQGSFQEIGNALQNCFDEFAKHQVYLQNLRVPFKPAHYTSAVPELLKLAKSHEERANQGPEKITPAMIEQKVFRFKERSKFFVTMKVIEKLFGITVKESEYSPFINPGSDIPPETYSKMFRTHYFECIDKSSAAGLAKWAAKCMYYIVHAFASLFIHSAINSIKSDFEDWQKETIKEKGMYVIQMARNIFTVISASYTSVSRTEPEKQKDIFLLLDQAVKVPSRNAGLPPEQFYGSLVKTGLKFVRINWTKKVESYFDQCMIPTTSAFAFLNPFLDAINFFCKKILQALVYIPQTILNFLLQKMTAFFILRSFKPHTLIDERIDNLRDPLTATSFAIHAVIENKLRVIVERVRERLNQPNLELTNIPSADVQLEIATCVKSILEVLLKSRKHTVDELRQYDQADRTVLESIQREILEGAIPKARLPMATTLWTALQEVLSEESLLGIEYNIFAIADKIYDRKENVTEQQFNAVDKGISALADELIDVMMKKVLDDKLDLNNVRQQQEIFKFTTAFKARIQGFLHNLEQRQEAVANLNTPPTESAKAVKEMNAMIHAAICEEGQAQGKAGVNSYLHQGTQSELNELALGFKNSIEPISKKIKAMKDLQEQIDAHTVVIEAFSGARGALRTLEYVLCHPNENHNHPPDHYAAILDQHITVLRHKALYDTQELINQHNRFKEYQAQLKTADTSISHLQTVEHHWNVYIDLKRQNPNQNQAPVVAAYRNLIRLVHNLPQNRRRDMLFHLSEIHQCMHLRALDGLSLRFINALTDERNIIAKQMQQTRMELSAVKEAMELHFNNEQRSQAAIVQKRALLLQKNREMAPDIQALSAWENGVRVTALINVNFIPFMIWVQDTVHSLAVSETKKIMTEIRDIILLPFVYKCMVNQIGVKFLERYGKEHIKQT